MDVLAKERDSIRESGTEQSELKPAQLVLKKLIRPMVRGGCIDIACTEGRKPEFPNSSHSSTLFLGLQTKHNVMCKYFLWKYIGHTKYVLLMPGMSIHRTEC